MRKPRETLVVCEISGHWNATQQEFDHMLEESFKRYNWDLFSSTEVSPPKFRDPLELFSMEYDLHLYHPRFAPGANECCWISRKPFSKTWATKATALQLLVGRKDPTYLVNVRLKGWGRFSKMHTPAHTDGLRKANRFTAVYKRVLHFLSNYMPKGKRYVSADWNMHLKLVRSRQIIGRALRGLHWAGNMRQDNTEGNRVIDGAWTNMWVVEPTKTIPVNWKGFDHKMTITVLGR